MATTKYMPLRLTAKGKTLLAKVQSGKGNIQITKFAAGDGVYEPEEDYSLQEELKSKKQEFALSSISVETDDSVLLEVVITNKPNDGEGLGTGYKVREMAFYAEDPDEGEICYCISVGTDDLVMDYLPAYDGNMPATITNYFYVKVANADQVTITVSQEDKVYSQEGAGGLRIYEGKLQYLNESGKWIDLDADISKAKVNIIENAEGEINSGDPLEKIIGIIIKRLKKAEQEYSRILFGPEETEIEDNDVLYILDDDAEEQPFEAASYNNAIFSATPPSGGQYWAQIEEDGKTVNILNGKLVVSDEEPTPPTDATFFGKSTN